MTPSPPPSPSMPLLPPLTLIVATTPSLGIGLRGTLPWPPLKADLAFFARITKRPAPPTRTSHPASPPTTASNLTPTTSPLNTASSDDRKPINAVLMGRLTWESIPPTHRPLKSRINIIVSRSAAFRNATASSSSNTAVITASSIEDGVSRYQEEHKGRVGRVFVIGGASIYEQALGMGACERVLWTRVGWEGEVDRSFPGEVMVGEGGGGGNGEGKGQGVGGWRKRGRRELEEWCGMEGVGGVKREGEVEFEIEMWERDRETGGEGG